MNQQKNTKKYLVDKWVFDLLILLVDLLFLFNKFFSASNFILYLVAIIVLLGCEWCDVSKRLLFVFSYLTDRIYYSFSYRVKATSTIKYWKLIFFFSELTHAFLIFLTATQEFGYCVMHFGFRYSNGITIASVCRPLTAIQIAYERLVGN